MSAGNTKYTGSKSLIRGLPLSDHIENERLLTGTYAQVEKVYSAFENAGYELTKSMGSIETAKSRLRDGKGSLVSRVKKMIKLGGLKPDKVIPDTEEISSTKIKKIK